MKNAIHLFAFAIITTLLMVGGCHCKDKKKPCQDPTNPKCENYDPCYGKRPTADFTISQWFGFNNTTYTKPAEICDTILTNSVLFEAKMKNANQYIWKIGSDDREFNHQKFNISFFEYKSDESNLNPDNPNYMKSISITLNVKNSSSKCIGKDTSISFTRNLVLVSFRESDPTIGKYIGKFDDKDIERLIEIKPAGGGSGAADVKFHMINFPNLSNKDTLKLTAFGSILLKSYKTRIWWDFGLKPHFDTVSKTYPFDGLSMFKFELDRVDEQDFVTISYRYVTDNGEYKEYTFRGRKIN